MNSRSYQFADSQLTVVFGDITSSNAQVIVSSDDCYVTMGGGVSGAILAAGGQEIMIDAAKKVPAKLGDVVVTTAGRLNAQYVFHAITIEQYSDKMQTGQVVRQCVSRCFDLLDALGLPSIAFPAIGAGIARFSYEDVAVEMANVIAERLTRSNRPLQVTLFLFDRFGRMQPFDFVQFFEEFARRMPPLESGDRPTLNLPETLQFGQTIVEPSGAVARQQETRLKLNGLTEERSELEEKLAGAGGPQGDEGRLRARLDELTTERIEVLRQLQHTHTEPVSVFISYSHKDQELRQQLEEHMAILKRNGVIATWHDRQITAGSEWKGAIDDNLAAARLILLLISPAFVASDYCYDVELRHALDRHASGEAVVIPIILRPVMWDSAPFAKLQGLPTDGKAVTMWDNRDDAFHTVAKGIRVTVESITAKAKALSV